MKGQKPINKRRTFTVREQMLGKLGPGGFGALKQQLDAQAQTKQAA